MTRLDTYSKSRDNNFNLIRLLAAFAVVVNHSTTIVHGEVVELLQLETGYSLGNHAVSVFFVVSGFLITQSLMRSRDIYEYVSARVLRLIPGLVLAAFITAFIMGPLVTSASIGEYYSDLATWTYVPFIGSLIMESSIPLKGVFDTLPSASIVNTPLWTLRWEFLAYMGVAVLGGLGVLSSRSLFGLVFAGFIALFIYITAFTDLRDSIDAINNALRLGFSFLLGSALYMFRKQIPVGILPVVLLWAITYLTRNTVVYQLMLITSLGYSAFWLAYVPSGFIRQYNRLGDISYGVYIYGFPISQLLIMQFPGLDPVALVWLSIPFILIVANLSYYLVEAPAMEKRKQVAAYFRSLLSRHKSPDVMNPTS